tara:strand:+ start:3866 stop:5125 length:1260 start_codon:yes stop_codon:yes gene_type:complete
MSTEFDLNMHTARLLMDEPFFAAISRRIDKRASFALPTAGIMVNQDTAQFEMLYNPDFFDKLTDAERQDVLKHEFYHVIFLHVTGRLPAEVDMRLWNVATDLAINSHLHNLPKGGLIPGEPDTPFADLPRGQSAEWYLANMPDFGKDEKGEGMSGKGDPSEQQCQGGSGQGNKSDKDNQDEDQDGSGNGGIPDSLDDHSGWGECSQEIKDMASERLKETVRKATEESSRSNSWGSVSSSVRQDIMKMFETKIDWKKLLRYFVKTSQRSNKASSIKRINSRYPYIHPGRKTSRVARVAVSVDQSGSVDDNMLALFFAELNKLSAIAEFVVVPFDTRVDDKLVYTWKKGMKKKPERVMRGGTCFDAPTDYVNERGFDGHIVLTDMCAPKPKSSKCQRMWMTTPQYAKRPYFETKERVIAIE